MQLAGLAAYLRVQNVLAFSRVVREGESRQDERAYRMRFGGHGKPPVYFDDLSRHPQIFEPTRDGKRSSAAGAYQATWTTWSEFARETGAEDFQPATQDAFFVWCLRRRGALAAVLAGRFDEACRLCRTEWTSLPGGAEENAATAHARDTYLRWGGAFDPQPAPALATAREPDPLATEHYDSPQEAPMPAPLVPIAIAAAQAFLPKLIDLIPALGAAFGSGSEVQQRNVAAATMVAKAVTETIGSPNLQTAIEEIERDPAKLAAVREAVNDLIPTLVEAGGGGIKGAREAAASQSGDWRKLVFSLPFVGLLVFTPAIWLVVAASVLKMPWLVEMDAQLRGTVIGFVMGTLGGSIAGYIYGSSMSRNPTSTPVTR